MQHTKYFVNHFDSNIECEGCGNIPSRCNCKATEDFMGILGMVVLISAAVLFLMGIL